MKAVIFDLGRVLIHYNHVRTLEAVAAVCRTDLAAVQSAMREVSDAVGIGEMGVDDLHEYFVEHLGATQDFDLFLNAFCAGEARDEDALAYAVDIQSRSGVTVGIISNTNEGHVRWLDTYVPELKRLDLVMMSNEVGMAKPDPAIYLLALDLLGIDAEKAIFVDDLEENVAAARALGMAGIVHAEWGRTRPVLEDWLA